MKYLVVFLGLIVVLLSTGESKSIRNVTFDANDVRRLAMQNPDLYDGDMAGIDGPFDAERNAIPGNYYRWPGARVPYVIDRALQGNNNMFGSAFQNYHQYTCVKFVPRTNERDFIYIFAGQGCFSHVGKTGGQQPLSLGQGCMFVGTIIHELGHALGFYHEQNRSDRDNYLTIYLNNVLRGMESNFAKLGPNQNILFTAFDYNSIMIYGNAAFSTNGYWTMEAKNGQRLYEPYEKNSMTWSDIERVNKMYGCK